MVQLLEQLILVSISVYTEVLFKLLFTFASDVFVEKFHL